MAGWPFPLQVRSSAETEDDLRRIGHDGHQRLTAGSVVGGGRVKPDVERALRALTRTVVWVDVFGFAGPGLAKIEEVLRFLSGTGWRVLPSKAGVVERGG